MRGVLSDGAEKRKRLFFYLNKKIFDLVLELRYNKKEVNPFRVDFRLSTKGSTSCILNKSDF